MTKINKLYLRFIKERGLYQFIGSLRDKHHLFGWYMNDYPNTLNCILDAVDHHELNVGVDEWRQFVIDNEKEEIKKMIRITFGDYLSLVLPKKKKFHFFNQPLTIDEFVDSLYSADDCYFEYRLILDNLNLTQIPLISEMISLREKFFSLFYNHFCYDEKSIVVNTKTKRKKKTQK